jgi:hypothetical protein
LAFEIETVGKWRFGGDMEFTDWMLIKAGVLVVCAFIYGLWCGFTGRK